jgi:hypothetical protein
VTGNREGNDHRLIVRETLVRRRPLRRGERYLPADPKTIRAFIDDCVKAAGKVKVGYTMTLSAEGAQPQKKMSSEFSTLEHGFKMTE